MRILACCLLVLPISAALSANGEDVRIRISAGDYDRQESVITFPFLGESSGAWVAEDSEGARSPVQISGEGEASFILPGELAAGESVVFALKNLSEAEPTTPWVEVLPEAGRLRLSVSGNPVVYYQAEERPFPREGLNPQIKRGGFLHPVMTPDGNVVSQSYARGHPHHQGIWTAWTRTEFDGRQVDYWNMQNGLGKVEFRSVEKTWSGPVAGGFEAKHEFVDVSGESPRIALLETWKVKLFQVGAGDEAYHLFELDLFHEPAGEVPMVLPEYRYGGLGFRGPDAWLGAENTFFLTSEGETDRVEGHGTRTRWTHVSGMVNGEQAGIAILGHPGNFRAPQPVRLHPTEPFFCFAPSQLGDWAITKEEPYRARYRFVVADGEPDAELIERLWNDFAYPVKVEILD